MAAGQVNIGYANQTPSYANAPAQIGQEQPRWRLPNGNAPDIVARAFLRSDTPSGLSYTDITPESTQAFRDLIRAGALIPDNDAARAVAQSYGGWQPGDMTPLGPIIEGKPGGLDPDYWNVLINKVRAEGDIRVQQAAAQGYFGDVSPAVMPDGTLDLQNVNLTAAQRNAILAYQQQVYQNETQRRLADNTIRQTDMDEAFRQKTLAEQQRQFNTTSGLTAQELYGGRYAGADAGAAGTGSVGVPGQPGSGQFMPTENARQFNTTQSGWLQQPDGTWVQTLAGQQQGFAQQQAVAQTAANPRNYIEAAMLGASRGGLAGQAPSNALYANTPFVPPGAPGAGQPGTPGYAGQSGMTPAGEFRAPVSAFSAALLKNLPTTPTGAIQNNGFYTTQNDLQSSFNPNQIRAQDYLNGTPSEQAGFQSLASFAGFDPNDVLDTMRKNLPQFKAPTASSLA